MPDYAAMYKRLFQSQTLAIEILQKAQQDTEEMIMSAPDPVIWLIGDARPKAETAETDDSGQDPEE